MLTELGDTSTECFVASMGELGNTPAVDGGVIVEGALGIAEEMP